MNPPMWIYSRRIPSLPPYTYLDILLKFFNIVMMYGTRIGIEQASIALSDKERLVAFCFALKIKLMFRSSDLHYNSKNQAAAALGYNKRDFTHYLDLATKFGYVRIDTNKFGARRIVANAIQTSFKYSYKVAKGEITKLSLPNLKSLVRKVVVANKINTIQSVLNTHDNAVNGRTIKSVRSARKTESRMLRKQFDGKYTSYSYKRMMQDISGTYYQAKKAISTLTKSGTVKKMIQATEVGCDPCACTNNFSYRDANGCLIVISAKYRKAQLRCANKYKMEKSQISISKTGSNQHIVEKTKRKK